MKRIIILRHGEAELSQGDDHSRMLTSYGREQVGAVASELSSRSWLPDAIICSDSKRTLETLAGLKKTVDLSNIHEKVCRKFYLAGYDQIMEEAAELADHVSTLLLIGHNPGWSDTVGVLTGHYHNLGTGQAALLTTDEDEDWIICLTSAHCWKLEGII